MEIRGQIADIANRRIYSGTVVVEQGRILEIREEAHNEPGFIMPGFVDAHIHIESSMLVPSEFARKAVLHGTLGTISDPHEIANVLGVDGVRFMIENGKKTPFKFHFGAPSCVPATSFETAGAVIDSDQIEALLNDPDISYLAEMMNYPGVIFGDEEVHRKIAHAHRIGKPVDGHAPGVRGEELKKYVSAGITTDHECFTAEEALEKLSLGMKILIREGSAAKNFDALEPLIREHWQNIMFCSDDKHPDDLMLGHINELCARAVAKGHDLFHVLQMACLNPIDHYKMRLGRLQAGDAADFIVVEDLKQFKVLRAFIDGKCVVDAGKSAIPSVEFPTPNQFETGMKAIFDFKVQSSGQKLRVIEAIEGQLITREFHVNTTPCVDLQSDISGDILKLAVVNRYSDAPVAIAFIKNFGLKSGAIASSVAHDSHNIIAVGSTDEALCAAVNAVISQKGGICTWSPGLTELLPLPVAGIMSDADCETTAAAYERCDALAKTLGCTLKAPFMTLSFMALLVIPDLKLSDKGLFSGNSFAFTPLSF